ncbi:MAG: Rieske 2Fe-2S domain-containing protein [Bryobacterales bacterium]
MSVPQTGVNLGAVRQFVELPAKVVHAGQSYFLVRQDGEYALLSTTCPHQGGQVTDAGDQFVCGIHQWRFDRASGRCLNAPTRALHRVAVRELDGFLYADLEPAQQASAKPAGGPKALRTQDLSVQLVAHACLAIRHQGRTVLTDPWLFGPAFLGSWTQYPPAAVEPGLLESTDAIFLSHEHSDHFHEATLERFSRDTPVYAPDFPNRRIIRRLEAMGFTRVTPMTFGRTYTVSPGMRITCFEPASLWNDAIVLIEAGDFRLLNLNDAGINFRLASVIGRVHAIAAQFSPGASGYPWNWAHLDEEEKIEILRRSCEGKLNFLREAAAVYQADYVLPIASYFLPWHPHHRDYLKKAPRNGLVDVQRAFSDDPSALIDLLPGEAWQVAENRIDRRVLNRDELYRVETLAQYAESAFDEDVFARFHGLGEEATREQVEGYLLGLNRAPEMMLSEDVAVRLEARGENAFAVDFAVENHRLRLVGDEITPQVVIRAPSRILRRIVEEDLSWDEAFIGYWCRFDRSPDVYHPGFWRLLQAPYFRRNAAPTVPAGADGEISLRTPVQELLERYGAEAERILSRYGLYCGGCYWATAETLSVAAAKHGLSRDALDALLQELNGALGAEPASAAAGD